MAIQEPNTSGQGFDPDHTSNPSHGTITALGYTYSHSTPVIYAGQVRINHHTYKYGEHNVSVWLRAGTWRWSTSVSCGSGRGQNGEGDITLRAHLQNKRRRYRELRGQTNG